MNPFLFYIYNLFVNEETPARLAKQPTKEDYIQHFECWVQKHFAILSLAAIVFLIIFFVVFCYSFVGVSATESGAMRNFLIRGV